jgi:hypothetical protein
VVLEVAREVNDFLRDANVPLSRFVRELQRVRRQGRAAAPRSRR